MEIMEIVSKVSKQLISRVTSDGRLDRHFEFHSSVFADCLHPESIDLRQPDRVLQLLPESCAITDCKSLYDALEKNESLGLGLSEKRTSIEVTATRQQMRATGINTRWVNSDRQLADVLTKPTAPSASIHRLQQTGRWKIVWDADFTSAKNIRKEKRDKHFKGKQVRGKTTQQDYVAFDPQTDQADPVNFVTDMELQSGSGGAPKYKTSPKPVPCQPLRTTYGLAPMAEIPHEGGPTTLHPQKKTRTLRQTWPLWPLHPSVFILLNLVIKKNIWRCVQH